eukprot:2800341-Pyramimonas_sp.AAC.1
MVVARRAGTPKDCGPLGAARHWPLPPRASRAAPCRGKRRQAGGDMGAQGPPGATPPFRARAAGHVGAARATCPLLRGSLAGCVDLVAPRALAIVL